MIVLTWKHFFVSDEVAKTETFAIRFSSSESGQTFKAAFEDAVGKVTVIEANIISEEEKAKKEGKKTEEKKEELKTEEQTEKKGEESVSEQLSGLNLVSAEGDAKQD